MSALTSPRPGSIREVNRDKRPLAAGVSTFKGGLAACLAGFYGPATGDPNEVVVGRFYQSVSNSAGAAGDKSADIQFFRERHLFLVDNDNGAPVVVAGREKPCSVLDDHTATLFDPAKGAAFIVYDVTSEGVWVEFMSPASADDAGPRLQTGTSTLVAGTKTITGIVLTAASVIQVSMKDPGAGVLTSFAGFDVPVANRTPGAAGSFVINAIDNAKAVLATAVCTVDYFVFG